MRRMIALVGEQPLPNVIPVKHYSPDCLVLAYTQRTQLVAERIRRLFEKQITVHLLALKDAYDVGKIRVELHDFISRHNFTQKELLFNLTGGTKPMEFAALELARELQCKAFYYQSENNSSLIWPYDLSQARLQSQQAVPVNVTLNVEEALSLFVDKYHCEKFKTPFEEQVADALKSLGAGYSVLHNVWLDSVGPNVEVDWILCHKNTLAVGEVKPQAKKGDGIDQLNGVTDQRTLGTYTKKLIISAEEPHPNDRLLAEAYRITIIVVPSARNNGDLSSADRQRIVQGIRNVI